MVYTDDAGSGVRVLVLVLVAKKKWCKVKRLLATLDNLLMESEMVDHKVLEIIKEFIVQTMWRGHTNP
jgi:hypothetical protein